MILKKWDYKTKSYKDYEIPNQWAVSTYCYNMEQVVNCASCGNKISWGNTYTSLEIHNLLGFGYGVCKECYNEEWNRRIENAD